MIIMNDETHWLFLLLFVWSEAPSTDTAALSALASSTVLLDTFLTQSSDPSPPPARGRLGPCLVEARRPIGNITCRGLFHQADTAGEGVLLLQWQ